jgi:hypothetical protein
VVGEFSHKDANPKIGVATGELSATLKDGFKVLREDTVEDVSDWGNQKDPEKLVRFAAESALPRPLSRRAAHSAAAREPRRRAVRAERSTGAAARVERPRGADVVRVAATGTRRAAWPANTAVECLCPPDFARQARPRAVRAQRATDAADRVGAPHVADVVRAASGARRRAASPAATRAPAAARAARRAAARPSVRCAAPPARSPTAAARTGVVAHRAGAPGVVRCVGAKPGNGHLACAGGCHERGERDDPQRGQATRAVLAGRPGRAWVRSRHGIQHACFTARGNTSAHLRAHDVPLDT